MNLARSSRSMMRSQDRHNETGHLQLRYQPGLPISNGKLCVWLFLSTEIMFFSALIGAYIVLRFGAPSGSWPTPIDVHLVEWIGAMNTLVLICSSFTIVMSIEAAKSNNGENSSQMAICDIHSGGDVPGCKRLRIQLEISPRHLPGHAAQQNIR